MTGYADFIIPRLKKQKCYDIFYYEFFCSKDIKPTDAGQHFSSWVCLVAPSLLNNCGFWLHEFTEMTLAQILERWGLPWQNRIEFKGYKSATICHFIALSGLNNGRNLNPQLSKKNPKW